MKKYLPLFTVIGVLLIVGAMAAGAYNTMVDTKLQADNAWADVQVQYQRRSDLIGNLVSTARAAADFESSTFTEVTMARNGWRITSEVPAREASIGAAQSLDTALSRLIATFEAYPTLTATQGYRDLMVQLEGTENRVSVAVRDYNAAVRAYNSGVQRFPGMLFARMFGFSSETFFETDAPTDAPAVDF